MSLGSLPGRLTRRGVLLIDALLVRCYGVKTFTDDPECILRTSFRRLKDPVSLPGGARLGSGDKLLEIHFWNEHLPPIEEEGADMLWGRQFGRRLAHSLRLLAAWATVDPRCAGFAAVHGRLGFIPADGVELTKNLAARFGFMLELQVASGMRFWTGAFWAGLYAWWLMWTFNPHTLRRKRFRQMALSDLWMTRETVLGRYGEGPRRSGSG